MGTNYYRIPTSEEVRERQIRLIKRVEQLDSVDVAAIARKYATIQYGDWEYMSPWDEFIDDMNVHLGKRSGGWKFCWNFNGNKFYSNKEELLKFIRSGRVVNEYGELQDTEEFIEMALNWGQPDGAVFNKEYEDQRAKENPNYWRFGREHYDLEIDGLRVSTATDFS